MVTVENNLPPEWCVKIHNGIDKKHPVIVYLNKTYNNNHDGSAYYYGVYNNDSFCDPSYNIEKGTGIQQQNNIPILTLDEFFFFKR